MARTTMFALIVAATVSIGATAATTMSTLKGAYSEEQAQAGATLYAGRCAMCHGKALEGTFETPSLQGKFIANWSKAPIGDLTAYIGRAMPQFAPGSLTPEDTSKIVAFLLKSNGLPAGATALPSDPASLKRIMLEPYPATLSAKGAPKAK